jgi:hypothetical protein
MVRQASLAATGENHLSCRLADGWACNTGRTNIERIAVERRQALDTWRMPMDSESLSFNDALWASGTVDDGAEQMTCGPMPADH